MLDDWQTPWTANRIAELRQLWTDGLTCSQIALQMNCGISRNAVIGKVSRLGLPGRARRQTTQEHYRSGPISYEEKQRREAERLARRMVAQANRQQHKIVRAPTPPPEPIAAPDMRPCQLLELTRETCRWPIGEPDASDFFFCGAVSDHQKPYCPFHDAIAHEGSRSASRRPFIQRGWAA